MTCDARIRPMVPINDIEVGCDEDGDHPMHEGTLRDYARPGSKTVVRWEEADRRTFHGKWPGICPGAWPAAGPGNDPGCTLPIGHRGNHAP